MDFGTIIAVYPENTPTPTAGMSQPLRPATRFWGMVSQVVDGALQGEDT